MSAETESVREQVARAIGDARWGTGEWLGVPDAQMLLEADAALAAVADTPGLAEVLGRHKPVVRSDSGLVVGCQCMDRVFFTKHESWGIHLADVVRAWLRGQG